MTINPEEIPEDLLKQKAREIYLERLANKEGDGEKVDWEKVDWEKSKYYYKLFPKEVFFWKLFRLLGIKDISILDICKRLRGTFFISWYEDLRLVEQELGILSDVNQKSLQEKISKYNLYIRTLKSINDNNFSENLFIGGLLLIILILVYIIAYIIMGIFKRFPYQKNFLWICILILFIYLLTIIIYYNRVKSSINKAEQAVDNLKEDLKEKELESKLHKLKNKWQNLVNEEQELQLEFSNLHILNLKRNSEANDHFKKARTLLFNSENDFTFKNEENNMNLSKFIDNINDAETELNNLRRLILKQKNDDKAQKYLEFWGIRIIIFYTLFLLLIMFISYYTKSKDIEIPFFYIPLWTIVAGLLGSIASMLYRSSIKKPLTKDFEEEARQFTARPILGIVMSIVSYVLLEITLKASGTTDTSDPNNIRNVGFAICFITSFSDRAINTIINTLLKMVDKKLEQEKQMEENDNNIFQQKKDIEKYDSTISQRKKDIEEKESRIKKLEEDIKEKESRIKKLEEDIKEKESNLEEIDNQK